MSAARGRRAGRLLTAPLAALALAAGACGGGGDPAPAPPAEVAVAGGRTTIAPAPGLREAGIRIAPIPPAGGGGRAVSLPIRGGRLSAGGATGVIAHRGGLLAVARRTEVEIVDLRLDAGAGEVSATVAARRIPLLLLDGRPGPGGLEVDRTARLTPEAATLLNDLLGIRTLSSGSPFGLVRVRARAGADGPTP